MAQLIDTSKTTACENCHGEGTDPKTVEQPTVNPDAVYQYAGDDVAATASDEARVIETAEGPMVEVPAAPATVEPEGCAVCNGRGEVLTDEAVILDTDDLEELMRESFKHAENPAMIIAGVDSAELPLIENPDPPQPATPEPPPE